MADPTDRYRQKKTGRPETPAASYHGYHAFIDGTDARHLACMHSSTDVSLVSTNQTNAFYRFGLVVDTPY